LYVFLEDNIPVYIGISRNVSNRLKQHIYGGDHNQSSLVYMVAIEKHPEFADIKRKELNKKYLEEAQEHLKHLSFAFIPIECDTELYLFEVYCARKWKTKWNTFRTH
jgi:predicted GIY-YIG superfamily endonuclease